MNYKTRMLEELLELTERILNLENFSNKPINGVTKEKLELCSKQLVVMEQYQDILIQRLRIELGD